MVDIGRHAHIDDVVTGVAGNDNGILVCGRKLFLDGVEETKTAFTAEKHIDDKDRNTDLSIQTVRRGDINVGKSMNFTPGIEAVDDIGDDLTHAPVVVNNDHIQSFRHQYPPFCRKISADTGVSTVSKRFQPYPFVSKLARQPPTQHRQ